MFASLASPCCLALHPLPIVRLRLSHPHLSRRLGPGWPSAANGMLWQPAGNVLRAVQVRLLLALYARAVTLLM